MSSILYYNATQIYNKGLDLPGIDNLLALQKIVAPHNGILDRTGTIILPFKTQVHTPLPDFSMPFTKTYEECAMGRMAELDQLHRSTGKTFRLLYSGGIDSTGIFAAFIGYYGVEKASRILEICCSREAIQENPWTWQRYISKYNFKLSSSHNHNNIWNDADIINLMGEGNDQLVGTTITLRTLDRNGNDVYRKMSSDDFSDFLKDRYGIADSTTALVNQIIRKSPVPVDNIVQLMWWLIMAVNWDSVMLRSLVYNPLGHLRQVDLSNGLPQFYNTPDFHRWSYMYFGDFDKKIMTNYKYPTKDMILKILNIPEYASKEKYSSFSRVQSMIKSGIIIDDDLSMKYDISDFKDYIDPNSNLI